MMGRGLGVVWAWPGLGELEALQSPKRSPCWGTPMLVPPIKILSGQITLSNPTGRLMLETPLTIPVFPQCWDWIPMSPLKTPPRLYLGAKARGIHVFGCKGHSHLGDAPGEMRTV